jgi:hypothetical protein
MLSFINEYLFDKIGIIIAPVRAGAVFVATTMMTTASETAESVATAAQSASLELAGAVSGQVGKAIANAATDTGSLGIAESMGLGEWAPVVAPAIAGLAVGLKKVG